MTDIVNCRGCDLPIELIGGTWVVMGTDTTADGLTYCPPDPDHDGELGYHEPPCKHEWVAGMMIVHPEDLEGVASARQARGERPMECSKCDHPYYPIAVD